MKKMMLTGALLMAGLVAVAQEDDPPSINPVDSAKARVYSKFGMRFHPIKKKNHLHAGVDIVAPKGTPILATSDGIVEMVRDSTVGYGKHLVIRHDEEYTTLYAHLSKYTIKEGQEVCQGDIIGYLGATGDVTGAHLHYEVKQNGKLVNPEEYFDL